MKLPWWTYTPERAQTAKKLFIWLAVVVYYIISLTIIFWVTGGWHVR